jgi:protein-S-isoprenylcysteine O-methyltransferase Ste14
VALARHLLAILLLPFVVVVIVPIWIVRSGSGLQMHRGETIVALAAQVTGVAMFAAGLALFVWCVVLFAKVGRGTLAPWDPTRNLVAAGPYRHTRNPMITAVAAMLVGEALYSGSVALAVWSALFIIINQLYFVLSEEPGLERRFGAEYTAYRQRVPRWLPRRRPDPPGS